MNVLISGVDYGQGTYTMLQQVAAQELSVPLHKVQVVYDCDHREPALRLADRREPLLRDGRQCGHRGRPRLHRAAQGGGCSGAPSARA